MILNKDVHVQSFSRDLIRSSSFLFTVSIENVRDAAESCDILRPSYPSPGGANSSRRVNAFVKPWRVKRRAPLSWHGHHMALCVAFSGRAGATGLRSPRDPGDSIALGQGAAGQCRHLDVTRWRHATFNTENTEICFLEDNLPDPPGPRSFVRGWGLLSSSDAGSVT